MLTPQKRIGLAIVLGIVLVAGAYVEGSSKTSKQTGTLVAQQVERAYVQPEDANGNGVPDWQDSLLEKAVIEMPSASSTYQKPTTVTGTFGIKFFQDYIRSKMYGAFGASKEELVAKLTQSLKEQAVDELLTEKDITRFETTDTQILHSYANQVALVLTANPAQGDSELYILQDYMRYNDPQKLQGLEPIALAYTTTVKNLLETKVPIQYTKQHLDLLNAVNAVREDVRGFQKIQTDALYSLLRLKRYHDDVLGMSNAIKNLFNALYLEGGIRFRADEPVSKLMVFPS